MFNSDALDALTLVAFLIGIANYNENLTQNDKDDIMNHLDQQTKDILLKVQQSLDEQYTMKRNPLYSHISPDEAVKAQGIDMSITGADRDKGVIRNVDMSKVATTQPWVNTSAIRNAIQNPGSHQYSSDLPAVVMHNGKAFLVDGNHRGVTAFLRGDRKLKVRVIN